jgi:hypothetical protein
LNKFPTLSLVKRHGMAGAIAAAVLCAAVVCLAAWPTMGWATAIVAILLGGIVYVLAKCLVELITLITDVLMPE